ncbi:DUF397 domain-containing protein [Streptomyces griseorubiginosus]|uniref:DUF397 domain-containing protein n=1 Tax=Streptomyces griseorubiginosus TaxID=67304 RepID=UPI002E818DCD|nr:DUF397 domain-containing protein [Streptomyces griseorubiginosus]WUB46206.1 DUF397 domain-containing protein [Streptomyces griseorubiginosus]WUB54727.1 DUF397 domain-containing protein [Streptomyces griseorubiginosus]
MSEDLHWFKSSYSGDQGECLEVAHTPATIHVRDSKTHTPALTVTPTAWSAFLRSDIKSRQM